MTVVQRSPTAGIHSTQIVIPATAGIHSGGRRWVPVSTGTTGGGGAPTIIIPTTAGGRRTHDRHSRDGGNPRRGGRRWVPVSTGTTVGDGAPTIVIPATAGIHSGGPAMGSPLHGNDGRRRAHPTIVIPATAGIHGGGAGDGFPSPRERRWAAVHPQSSFPRRRESTAGGPAMGSPLHRNDGGRRCTHNRHSRDGGNPQQGAGDGFPYPRERRWAAAHPQSSFPRRGNPQRGAAFLSAAPNRYRGGRGLARRRTCDTMTSAGIDGRSTRRRPAAPTLVGSRQPAEQRTCQS